MSRHVVEVRPNCSLSWRGAVALYLWVCAISLSIALVFAWQGYWPVLPFAGLELAVLGGALWVSMRRGDYREVITIHDNHVIVEKGTKRQRQRIEFSLHWARVNLRSAHASSHSSRLAIGSHGRSCEIGHCLTESEKLGLARRLRELIGGADQTPARWLNEDRTDNAHR